jgi:hypothetical protein
MNNRLLLASVFVLFFVGMSAVPVFAYETTYTYDKLRRLTSATHNDGTGRMVVTYQYDAVGNRLSKLTRMMVKGDLDGDSAITVADAIASLQIISGITPNLSIIQSAEVNSDGRIGLPEAIYILQKTAGMRP